MSSELKNNTPKNNAPKNNDHYYIYVGKVYTENQVLTNKYILIADGVFADISDSPTHDYAIIDYAQQSMIPGLIDLHVHGREGCDVMDAKMSSISTISSSLAKHGVTGFLATTVTASWEKTLKAFNIVGKAVATDMPGAQVLGAYNEGLFFTETHKGAHNQDYFLPLTKQRIDDILQASNNSLKVMAMAPEFEDSVDNISYLRENGVKVMLGHTNANFEQTEKALCCGASGGVHIFNGMSGVHHRDPGCAGAVLMNKDALAEVIADGIHLHPTIMQLIYRLKGQDKIALISDCINAGGYPDGIYQLGELEVIVEAGVARTKSGSLAGSTLTLNKGVLNMANLAEIPLLEAINMASIVPAKHLDLENEIGSIALGKKANFAIVNEDLTVETTIISGRTVYQKN